jgi:ABC-type dipeptide/oligopeptide/nickel transport system permease component
MQGWGWRILSLLAVFFGASLLVFGAVQAMPEDPVALRVKNPDPARVQEIRESLGLNDPWWEQYGNYLRDFVTGNWGQSLISGRAVREEVANYFPATLELGLLATLLGVVAGLMLVLGSEALGWKWTRKLAGGLGAIGLTIPIYWIGLLLVIAFAVRLNWFPVSGRYDFTLRTPNGSGFYLLDTLLAGNTEGFRATVRHLILPVVTLALYPAALVAGTLQARLRDPRLQKLIVALQAKGLGPVSIWGRHILRLLGAPVVTVVGTNFGALLGGAVLTETVFSWPGMGRFLVEGVLNRDVFVISHGLLLILLLAFIVVQGADRLAHWVNPVANQRGAGGELS